MSSTSAPDPSSADAPELTRYDLDEVAAGYDEWDNTICWVFGYPFVFQALRLGSSVPDRMLDLGCGPGFVSEHIARTYGVRVVGADASPAMIRRATDRHAHPLVEYRLITSGGLDFLADASVDGAFSCFVFISVPDLQTVRGLAAEAHRVLRPGGRFAVLEVHPDNPGVRFTSFQVGEPGHTYRDGELRLSQLFGGAEVLLLSATQWTVATMAEVLSDAGFVDVTSRAPLLADAVKLADPAAVARFDWQPERTTPPFIILSGGKPSSNGLSATSLARRSSAHPPGTTAPGAYRPARRADRRAGRVHLPNHVPRILPTDHRRQPPRLPPRISPEMSRTRPAPTPVRVGSTQQTPSTPQPATMSSTSSSTRPSRPDRTRTTTDAHITVAVRGAGRPITSAAKEARR